jgi:hypothetical protein
MVATVMQDMKLTMAKKYTSFASHFDGHADQVVRYRAHCPVRQVSRATLDATGRRHQASICPVLPWRTPWSSILKGTKQTLYSAHQSDKLRRKVEHHN